MEARVGIEPTHKGFADLSLTAWVPRHHFTIVCRDEQSFEAKSDFYHRSEPIGAQSIKIVSFLIAFSLDS
jgi:hypothetical protein